MENPRSLDNPNLKRGPRPSKACPAQGLPNCHEELWPRQQNDLIRFHRRTFRDILSVSLKGASFKYEQLHKYYRHLQHICIILYIYIVYIYIPYPYSEFPSLKRTKQLIQLQHEVTTVCPVHVQSVSSCGIRQIWSKVWILRPCWLGSNNGWLVVEPTNNVLLVKIEGPIW